MCRKWETRSRAHDFESKEIGEKVEFGKVGNSLLETELGKNLGKPNLDLNDVTLYFLYILFIKITR